MTEKHTATVARLVAAVEAARTKLTDLTLPAPADVEAFVDSVIGKDGKILKSPPKRATQPQRGFHKLLAWNLGLIGPNLGALFSARCDLGEQYETAETLAVVIGILSGRGNPNVKRWAQALGRTE